MCRNYVHHLFSFFSYFIISLLFSGHLSQTFFFTYLKKIDKIRQLISYGTNKIPKKADKPAFTDLSALSSLNMHFANNTVYLTFTDFFVLHDV